MVIELAKSVALLLALCFLQSFIARRWVKRELTGQVLSGLLFGGVCVIGMMTPIVVAPGVIFDARSVVLSMAGLFGGPVIGGIAAAIAGGYRAWLGGGGAPVGLAVVLSCVLLGLAYRHCHRRGWLQIGIPQLLAFGLLVHLVVVALFMFLPADVVGKVMDNIAVPLVLAFTPATALLGILLRSIELQTETENTLAESERRYRSLVEEAQLGIRIERPGAEILFANNSCVRMFGFEGIQEYLAAHSEPGKFIAPHDRERMLKVMTDRMAGKAVLNEYEFDALTKDGSIIPVQVFVREVIWGTKPALHRTFIDISNRRTAEKEAHDSQGQYQYLIETIPDAIYVQIDGKIQYANPAACKMFRATDPDKLIGMPSIELFHSEHHDTIKARRKLSSKSGFSLPMIDVKHCRLDGTVFYGQSSGNGIKWEGKNAVLVIVRDISERKQTEDAHAKAKEAAETASQSKSLFLATMSHEIRTPMNGVLGMADLLARTELTAEQLDFVQTIRESGGALLDLLNDILDLSKIEAGRVEIEAVNFSVAELLSAANALWTLPAQKKGLVLAFYNNLTDTNIVRSDHTRLRQVLYNLIGNAIKFTSDGRIEIHADAHPRDDGRIGLRIEIRDTGIGISEEEKEKLFQPFTQADSSTTRQYGGTGLGLTISKDLVELLDGEMGVESVPGKGSTFWFTVPVERVDGNIRRPNLSSEAPALPTEVLHERSLHILVAEDNEINQRVAAWMLAPLNAQLDFVENGLEAVAAVTRSHYDLVLMDIQMPVMDGIAATKQIRSLAGPVGQIPIIAMTANAMLGDREKSLLAGMNDYVTKPVDQRELLSAITRSVGIPMPDLDERAGAALMAGDSSGQPLTEDAAKELDDLIGNLDDLLDGTGR